ncbi:MAG: alpha/beta hydrolase [Solirubrobacterales bacterium]|nr:alpha/beta hydrolase [Solirubrobacterales bacterium]
MLQTTEGHYSPAALWMSEPFQTYFEVPVAGGALSVARAGAPPEAGRTVVLTLHGMTSCHMVYRAVARELCNTAARPVCMLAPDARGRGRSARLPEPYGIAVHVADLIAVLDHVGAERAIVVGHSMGSNIAARFAADHPERTAAVLLLDSGLPFISEDAGVDDAEDDERPGLLHRLESTFATVEEYMAYWRGHPALKGAWDEDVEAYVHCDYVQDQDGVRCIANVDAVFADIGDLTFDRVTRTAVTRLRTPVRLMRAERGLFDDDPLIPVPQLEEFLRANPHVSVDMVPDVNHYTLVMGGGHGPRRVAATLAELADREP